jgi:hypothetical protein
MYKKIIAAVIAASVLAGCGGGSDSPAPTAKVAKLSFYGNPLGGSTQATAHAAVMLAAASAPVASSDAAAQTVQSLQDALAAQGVTATVTPQVMDGTTLHALIMGENNGLPPTDDQFKTDPSGYLVVNFKLDDSVTLDTATAALQQFKADLTTFIQRGHVSGKLVLVVVPIPTCDTNPDVNTNGLYNLTDRLIMTIGQATSDAGGFSVGGFSSNIVSTDGSVTNAVTAGHMGADCKTPDAYLLNAQVQALARDIAPRLQAGLGS